MGDEEVWVVNRSVELAAVDTFLSSERSGTAILVVEGEPGIGKTTIWQEALRRAGEQRAGILVARPSKSEATLAYSALADLFGDVSEAMIARLPAPQWQAMSAALLRVPVPEQGIDERALSASVLTLLRQESSQRRLIVAVDDAQWLDSPSARALSFAVRRLDTEPVGFLVAVRTAGRTAPQSFDRVAPAFRRRVLSLGPLSVTALHELIKQRSRRSLAPPVLAHVARASGGNPYYALEIAAELERRPLKAGRIPVPPSLTELVKTEMDRLPQVTRRALLDAAAQTQPTVETVRLDALGPAEQAAIVSVERGHIRFTHPIFASALYEQVDASERRRSHRRLAKTVTDPAERPRHLALGWAHPDEATADQLDSAAVLAAARGAPDAAAELVELALGLTYKGNDLRRTARLIAASRFWFDAGDLDQAQAMLGAALAEEPVGPLLGQALQLSARLLARRSSFAEARAVAFDALEAAGTEKQLHANIELDIAYCCVNLGRFRSTESHAQNAVDALEGSGEPSVLGDALSLVALADFLRGRGVDQSRISRALELEDRTRIRTWPLGPSFVHGLLSLWSGHLAEAQSVLFELRRETAERGEVSSLPIVSMYVTWVLLWRGNLLHAARVADEARHAAALLDDPGAEGMALAANALVHAHDGSIEAARDEAERALECFKRLCWPSVTIWPLWALALAELSSGNPGAVDAALGRQAEMLQITGEGDPILGVFLADEVEALAELGEIERAERLVQWLEDRGAKCERPWALAASRRCRGLVQAARRDHRSAVATLERAVVEYEGLDTPFERARAVLLLGRELRRVGRRADAKTALSEALTVFERVGAPLWAERTRSELRRAGGRAFSTDMLTATEACIAELAAGGLANVEIADRAFLSTKAVEANLTRVYRKLGIRSRARPRASSRLRPPVGSRPSTSRVFPLSTHGAAPYLRTRGSRSEQLRGAAPGRTASGCRSGSDAALGGPCGVIHLLKSHNREGHTMQPNTESFFRVRLIRRLRGPIHTRKTGRSSQSSAKPSASPRVARVLAGLCLGASSLSLIGVAGLFVGATPAGASTITLSSPTPLSGNQTLSSTGVTASGLGVTATFDLTETLTWTQAAQVTTTVDSNLVRQGRSANPSDSYSTTAPGNMSVAWTLNNLNVSWDGIGPLSLGSPSFSASGPCNLMASGPNYDCNLASSQISLLDTYPVPGPYVKLGLGSDVTITPQALASMRQAVFGGINDGTASLTLSETPVTDTLPIPCTVGAGDDLSYVLGTLSTTDGVSVANNLVFDVGAEFPNPLPPFNEIDVSFASPTVPLSTVASTITMSGPGATFDLGNVAANNIPPTVDAGGPYSGNEGSPIQFNGTGSSSICGFPTLVWNLSDGGVAYGPTPQHTFEGPGTFSGLLTATDPTGLTSTTTFSVTVADLPPVASAGPDMATEWGDPVTLTGSAIDPGTDQQPFLTYSWDFGDGSGAGGATVTHTYSSAGTYTATFTACDPESLCGVSTTQVVVSERSTVVSYTGSTASFVTDPAVLLASVVDDHGAPVVGRVVDFFADGGLIPVATAATNSFGIARTTYVFPNGTVGTHTITAAFTGDSEYTASGFGPVTFNVLKDGTVLTYTGPLSSLPSKSVTLTGRLTDDMGRNLAGMTVLFNLGSQSCSGVTDGSGTATCTIAKLTQKHGNATLTSSFAGNVDYAPSSTSVTFVVGKT